MSDPVENGAATEAPVKTEKQLKKEAEKAAKLAKLQEKMNKKQQQAEQAAVKPKAEVSHSDNNRITWDCIRKISDLMRF